MSFKLSSLRQVDLLWKFIGTEGLCESTHEQHLEAFREGDWGDTSFESAQMRDYFSPSKWDEEEIPFKCQADELSILELLQQDPLGLFPFYHPHVRNLVFGFEVPAFQYVNSWSVVQGIPAMLWLHILQHHEGRR